MIDNGAINLRLSSGIPVVNGCLEKPNKAKNLSAKGVSIILGKLVSL